MSSAKSSARPLAAFLLLVAVLSGAFVGAVLMWGEKGYFWAGPYMFTPAIAAVITRCFFYEKRFKDAKLRFGRLQDYLFFWAICVGITLLACLLYTLFGSVRWDFTGETFLKSLSEQMAATGQDMEDLPAGLTPKMMLVLFVIGGLTVFNIPGILQGFGEEFGWRGFVFPEFYKRMGNLAFPVCGAIWFLWHVPLMFIFPQTHEFTGREHAFNFIILAAGSVFSFVFFAYVFVKTQSIFVASFAHIVFNNAARSFSYFVIVERPVLANLALTVTMALVAGFLYWRGKLAVFQRMDEVESPT